MNKTLNWPKPRRVKFFGSCGECGAVYSFIPEEEKDPEGRHKDPDVCDQEIIRQITES